jgi:hypothetical protein
MLSVRYYASHKLVVVLASDQKSFTISFFSRTKPEGSFFYHKNVLGQDFSVIGNSFWLLTMRINFESVMKKAEPDIKFRRNYSKNVSEFFFRPVAAHSWCLHCRQGDQMGRVFACGANIYFGQFLNKEVAQFLEATWFHGTLYELILTQMGWDTLWAIFFTNSSGRPEFESTNSFTIFCFSIHTVSVLDFCF